MKVVLGVVDWYSISPGIRTTFFGPLALAVDHDGRVFVADTGLHRVVVFDSSGTFLQDIGDPPCTSARFCEPVGLATIQLLLAAVGRVGPIGLLGIAMRQADRLLSH